jgi:hypothetical protein
MDMQSTIDSKMREFCEGIQRDRVAQQRASREAFTEAEAEAIYDRLTQSSRLEPVRLLIDNTLIRGGAMNSAPRANLRLVHSAD